MQYSFTLRKDKISKGGLIPVRLLVTVNGERVRKNVPGVKTKSKDWKNERIKSNLKSEPYNFHIEFNDKLDKLENKLKSIHRYALLNEIPLSKEYILEKIDDKTFSNNSLVHNFIDSFDEFIEVNKSIKAYGTTKKYKSVLSVLKDFSNHTGYSLRFDSLNVVFYESFRDYCFNERNTVNNYFGKLIAVTKTFMNWSLDRGYHDNIEFKKFKAPQDRIEVIYLTMDELMKLFNHDFDSRKLTHVRDFYCFGCFTGLRFSDIKQLKSSNVFEDYLDLNIIKTKSIGHRIPLNKYAKIILDKYRGTLYDPLPKISGQKFNEYIKECCEEVEIDTPINITRYVGKKRVDKVLPKHKLITSHTARKTFVTNSLVLGMKEMVVKNITGHKDDASFKRYVEIAEDFKKKEMDNTWDKL